MSRKFSLLSEWIKKIYNSTPPQVWVNKWSSHQCDNLLQSLKIFDYSVRFLISRFINIKHADTKSFSHLSLKAAETNTHIPKSSSKYCPSADLTQFCITDPLDKFSFHKKGKKSVYRSCKHCILEWKDQPLAVHLIRWFLSKIAFYLNVSLITYRNQLIWLCQWVKINENKTCLL